MGTLSLGKLTRIDSQYKYILIPFSDLFKLHFTCSVTPLSYGQSPLFVVLLCWEHCRNVAPFQYHWESHLDWCYFGIVFLALRCHLRTEWMPVRFLWLVRPGVRVHRHHRELQCWAVGSTKATHMSSGGFTFQSLLIHMDLCPEGDTQGWSFKSYFQILSMALFLKWAYAASRWLFNEKSPRVCLPVFPRHSALASSESEQISQALLLLSWAGTLNLICWFAQAGGAELWDCFWF